MLRAERDLVRARLIPSDSDPLAAAFADAITSLRKQSTPYHLAHGLLDHADYLTRCGDADVAGETRIGFLLDVGHETAGLISQGPRQ